MKKILYTGNKLSKHGATITVIETLGASLVKEGFTVFYSSDKKNQVIRLFDMIFCLLQKGAKVDYVLIDTYSTWSFYYALIISQLCRVFRWEYIPILHGGNLPIRIEKNKFLSDLIFNNSKINVAPSGYLLHSFKSKGYTNIAYIPNTITITDYNYLERDLLEPKLLWVRSFSSIYNPKMAIEVLSKLKAEFPNATLCMVGPDKENMIEECKEYAKQLNVEVEFTGKLSKKEWIKLSEKYSIFINTTHFDNTPVSVIEAMALGLPVVSTNVGGIPYLLKDKENALLVADNDVEAMVFSIKELLNNKTLANQISKNGRQLVEQFDWDNVKEKWFKILK